MGQAVIIFMYRLRSEIASRVRGSCNGIHGNSGSHPVRSNNRLWATAHRRLVRRYAS
jgi:hypothetical protein